MDFIRIKRVPDPNRVVCFGANQKAAKMQQSIKNIYRPDLTAGSSVFFVNLNIIEQVAGVKSPPLRIVDNSRRLVEDNLKSSPDTAHRIFTALQLKKLVTTTIQEFQI